MEINNKENDNNQEKLGLLPTDMSIININETK